MTPREWFKLVLSEVRYHDWTFYVGGPDDRLYLQALWNAPCARTGIGSVVRGRKWALSAYMTRSEIVQTAFTAVLAAVEHEAREFFTYRHEPIFGPHYDVDRLHALCQSKAYDVRPPTKGEP